VVVDDESMKAALHGCTGVVHLAARVHVIKDQSSDPLREFRLVNVQGTAQLAKLAAQAGVRRFVYLSSIKVHGESTKPGKVFCPDDTPAPQDPYGQSKLEAEEVLREVAKATGMEVVIVRPPLVYGPGVRANFAAMMRAVARGWLLPFAGVTHNRRSLVALDNLVDLLITCLHHPNAANQTFLVSDGEDLSAADLLVRLGDAVGRPARLFYVPEGVLKWGAGLLGQQALYQRVCGSLQIDIRLTQMRLGWSAPVSVDEGLRRAAAGLD
jgi:nucleoside-diphosphate-sugar epimerase